MKRSFEVGFSMFELLVVLTLASVLTLAGLRAYHQFRQQRQVHTASVHVQTALVDAANHFNQPDYQTPSIRSPVFQQLRIDFETAPKRIILAAQFRPQISKNERLALAVALEGQLNETADEISWNTTPSAVLQPASKLWMLRAQLQQFQKRVSMQDATT